MMSSKKYDLKFTELEKIILALLFAKRKEPVYGKTKLQKMLFLVSQDLPSLREEMDFEAYKFGMYDQTIDDLLEGLEIDGYVKEENNKIRVEERKEGEIKEALKTVDKKIFEVIEEVKELINDLNEDEVLALVYFKFPEYSKYSEKIREIKKKRVELAISLYSKNKVSIESAAEIAGKSISEFMKILKNKGLL